MLVVWSGREPSTSLCVWQPCGDCPQPPLQAMCCCDGHPCTAGCPLWLQVVAAEANPSPESLPPTSTCHVPCPLLLVGLPAVAMLAVTSVLAMLALQWVAVFPVAGAGLYPVILQGGSRPVTVLPGAVCLVVPLGGLAVLLVFVDQHTLAAAPKVVLGGGRLRYLPPPMSALLHHCCG